MTTKQSDTSASTPEPKVRRKAAAKPSTVLTEALETLASGPSLMDEKAAELGYTRVSPVNVVELALDHLKSTLRDRSHSPMFDEPAKVHDYLRLKVGGIEDREVFGVLWIDGQGYLLEDELMAEGGLTETNICMKRVLRSALACNAHAAIVYHNHPSGYSEPSDNDVKLTHRLGAMLGLLEIDLVDHFVIGSDRDLTVASVKEYVAAKEQEEIQQKMRDLREAGIPIPEGADLPEGLLNLLMHLKKMTRR